VIRLDIRNRVVDYLDRSDLNTKIENWINDTRLDLAVKYNFRYLYAETTAPTEALTARYALPADYLGHLNVWCENKKLMRISSSEFDNLTVTDIAAGAAPRQLYLEAGSTVTTDSIVAPPDYYVERGMEIELYPTPGAIYTLLLKYYAAPEVWATGVSGDNEYDYITTFHPEAVVWGAALRGAIYLDDEQKKANFAAAYKSSIEEMVLRERANKYEDYQPRMTDWKDYDLSTFKRLVRINIPGSSISRWEWHN
jgi:hypothetical protein